MDNSFIIDKINFLKIKVYEIKFRKELKIFFDLKNSRLTLIIFKRTIINVTKTNS